MPPRYDDDPDLVRAAQAGSDAAFSTLFRRWFDPCYEVARRILHDEGRAAEIAQDTFLVAWQQIGTLRDPAAFGGWVLRSARNKALNRLERERRSVSTDDTSPILATLEATTDVAGEVTRAEHRDLVWAAAAALGERDASVLDLHLRHGLDAGELAEELDVTTNNAYQLLFRMKARLGSAVKAWVLYRDGEPSCDDLARALSAAGITTFGPAVVKVVEQHVRGCATCDERQGAVLAPEAMFAAVPLLAAPPGLRSLVAEGLRNAGVPLGPDAAAPWPTSADGQSGPADRSTTDQQPAPDGQTAVGDWAAGGPAPPPLAPVAGPGDDVDDARPRRAAQLAAAACAVLLLVVLAVVLATPGSDSPEVAAGSVPTTPPVIAASSGSDPVATSPPATAARSGSTVGTTGPTAGFTVSSEITTTTAPVITSTVPPSSTTTGLPPSTPSTALTTSTTAPPPAPVIDTFTATPATTPGGACPPGQWATAFVWTTTDAFTVAIEVIDLAPATGLPADGDTVRCRLTFGAPPGGWTLRATGPGGVVTRGV